MFTLAECKNLHSLSQRCAYNAAGKKKFKSLARKAIRELNMILGIQADMRWNEGGIAVSGEATLHGDCVYVQIQNIDYGIMYRTCKNRKDCYGGANQWYSWSALKENGVEGLAVAIERLVAQQSHLQRLLFLQNSLGVQS